MNDQSSCCAFIKSIKAFSIHHKNIQLNLPAFVGTMIYAVQCPSNTDYAPNFYHSLDHASVTFLKAFEGGMLFEVVNTFD